MRRRKAAAFMSFMTQRSHKAGAFRAVLRYSFGLWRRQGLLASGIAGGIVLATLAEVMTPFFAGRLVDAVASAASAGAIDEAAKAQAFTAFAAMAGLALLAVILRHAVFAGVIYFTLRMMGEVVRSAFGRVQRFSTDWHANSFAGSTVRKVTRGMWALDLLNDTLLVALLPSAVMLIGSTLLLGRFWPSMGLLIAVGSLAYLGVVAILSLRYVAPAASLANSWDTRLGGSMADAISCNSVVKAFGAETREEARLDRVMGKWRARTLRTWQRGNVNGTTQGLMLLALRIAILALALHLWLEGQASAGDVAFVLTTFFVLQGYLREMGMHLRNLQRSINDMEELVEMEAAPVGVEDGPGAKPVAIGRGGIVFDRVSFRYGRHATPLYRDLSLELRPGERVGLVGHSGSGKTTFVKLIQRLYDVTGGRILIDGQDIAGVRQASLRSQIAIVQQEPILFHRSLAENIAYAKPGASMAEIERAAERAGAHAFIARLPRGYGTLVGERGVKLSGGERQRVAIARAFLADAPILILDEATSSLDSESETMIQRSMAALMEGRTAIVVAHRLSTVRALDRLLVFDRGRIAEEGTHATLVAKPGGIYRNLFERQALELVQGLPDAKEEAARVRRA